MQEFNEQEIEQVRENMRKDKYQLGKAIYISCICPTN